MTAWTKGRVNALETTLVGWVRWSSWMKSEISTQVEEIRQSCRRIGEIQKEDNKALQWIYGERGEAEGAKMQQSLTGLLTAASVEPENNTRRDGLISTLTAEAVLDPLLGAAVRICACAAVGRAHCARQRGEPLDVYFLGLFAMGAHGKLGQRDLWPERKADRRVGCLDGPHQAPQPLTLNDGTV
jgi:hypothetical protein